MKTTVELGDEVLYQSAGLFKLGIVLGIKPDLAALSDPRPVYSIRSPDSASVTRRYRNGIRTILTDADMEELVQL